MTILDLATALLGESGLPDLPPTRGPFPTPWHKSHLARDTFKYANEPLFLCAQALNFSYGELVDFATPPGNRVAGWLSLVDDLNTWYTRRTNEFQSILEVDGPEDDIPTIMFTNGAGVFANQLYHTAMLLLLLHKPRTARLPSARRTSTMSLLWNIRRICGIALNNNLRSNWDPSLVASLVVAAKRMTHEVQHKTILDGLDRIGSLTSWDIDLCKARLLSAWTP
jgi:hypothetical protein